MTILAQTSLPRLLSGWVYRCAPSHPGKKGRKTPQNLSESFKYWFLYSDFVFDYLKTWVTNGISLCVTKTMPVLSLTWLLNETLNFFVDPFVYSTGFQIVPLPATSKCPHQEIVGHGHYRVTPDSLAREL